MTDVENAVLTAARNYAEALKLTWGSPPDYSALRKAEAQLLTAASRLVPDEKWDELGRIRSGKTE